MVNSPYYIMNDLSKPENSTLFARPGVDFLQVYKMLVLKENRP